MYKIIVASHGPMAQGMKDSLEFVMGPGEKEILVMVDFLFGSPFNEFSKLAASYEGKMEIITGVNLPALVEAVSSQESGENMETVIPRIKESAEMKTLREVLEEEDKNDDDE